MDRKRGKTLQYDKKALEQAVNAVNAGESIRKAAARFNVPKSTIGDRISGRFDITQPLLHGRPPAIPAEIENKIVDSVKMAAKLGVGLSRKQIITRTNVLCRRIKIDTSYPNFKAGKDWWEGVKRRHPEITIRKPEKLSTVRARMLNPVVVESYFKDLKKIIEDVNLSSSDIWNCDETGLNFEHCPVKVVAERGSTVVSKTSQKSSNLTIMACVNAAGDTMPPLVITKGKTVKSLHGFKTTDAPSDTVWSYQEKGWITDEIGEKWFNNVFLKHCGPKRPQLLIFDGHSSHETLAILERAIEEDIVLLSLPPHTTHYLQPLDRSVFGPFKKAYNEKCSEFMSEHPLHVVNKHTFPSLLTKAWDDAFSESNVKSGFSSCGIWPLNRSAIPKDAYTPSFGTDVPHATPNSMDCIPRNKSSSHLENQSCINNNPTTNSSCAPCQSLPSISPVRSTPTIDVHNVEDSSEVMTATPLPHYTLSLPEENEVPSDESHAVNVSLPVLDLSDPAILLKLISSGNLLMDCVDDNKLNEIVVETPPDLDDSISEVFLPPKIESRNKTKNNVVKKSSHTILTSDEIIQQKREIQLRKDEKEVKMAAKRVKKENKDNGVKKAVKRAKKENV